MAVDSNGANNGTNGVVPAAAPATAKGTGANPAITQQPRRKRSSSLMKSATSLPTVEHSLEEFIAKANQTLVDVSSWDAANEAAKQEDAQRREQDQQRWKAAETQMRESAAREQSLRRQLDGLQGKLAEAEARAAVAGTQMGSAAHDSTINDLKTQIEKAMQRMRAAEERSAELANEIARKQAELNARPASEPMFGGGAVDGDADERVRLAEAKAAKALAAARAAQAGLTVSPADLAAIESGLVVSAPVQKKTPWLPILLAFAGGIAIMFGVWKLVLDKDSKAPVAAASAVEPAAPPAGGAAAKPSVTPIDDSTTPQPAGTEEAKKPADEPKVEPIKEAPEVEPVKDEPKTEPAVVKDEPKAEPAAKPAAKKATAKAAAKRPAKAAAKKATKADLADPFADAPAPAKKPAKAEKPAGGIVDPF